MNVYSSFFIADKNLKVYLATKNTDLHKLISEELKDFLKMNLYSSLLLLKKLKSVFRHE